VYLVDALIAVCFDTNPDVLREKRERLQLHTFGGVGSLVILPEQSKILVFYPWHPLFILTVVDLLGPFCIGLLALLVS
jgi:hypothetical protein